MSEACELFKSCKDLDVRTYIWRTFEGPSVAVSDGTVPFTEDTAVTGISTQVFIQLLLRARATLGDACIGPARSVLGLGPMESFTYVTSRTRELELGALIRKAVERTNSTETSIRDALETVNVDTTTTSSGSSDSSGFSLGPFGSWDFGGENSAEATEHVVGETVTHLTDVLTTTLETETESTETELSASFRDTTTQATSRTLVNPYHDRSMLVRFHPVYREVILVLEPTTATVGLAMTTGKFARVPTLAAHGEFLNRVVRDKALVQTAAATMAVPRVTGARAAAAAASPAERQLQTHLQANNPFYAAAWVHEVRRTRGPEPVVALAQRAVQAQKLVDARQPRRSGLAFDRLTVRGDRILIPASNPETFAKTVKLPAGERAVIGHMTNPAFLERLRQRHKKEVRLKLFMGTHVEVVPGKCVLPDVPEIEIEPEPEP
jgi:hypothetical protein